MQKISGWKIRVDVGGTFTDGWAVNPEGVEIRGKVLSSGVIRVGVAEVKEGWVRVERGLSVYERGLEGFLVKGERVEESVPREGWLRVAGQFEVGETIDLLTGEDAPVVMVRVLTGTAVGEEFPAGELRVATTRGTNALLEGKGEPVVLLTTRGFESLLEVRDQRRPDLFEMKPKLRVPIVRRVVGVPGRVGRRGEVVEELDLGVLEELGDELEGGLGAVAVALVNADVEPGFEGQVGDWLRARGVREVSLSHECAPVIRLWPRMETTVANAYLTPVMGRFLGSLRESFERMEVRLMTSAGLLKGAEEFRPMDSLLSGPAGGVVGAAAVGRAAGAARILTFDMGGTSTDVARVVGEAFYRHEQEVGPVRVLASAVKMETVAAGGGSICQWRNGGLEVGPESAGSDPGPACYGRGGPLTVTDVNLLLGLMEEQGGGIPFDRAAAAERFEELRAEVGERMGREELLWGLRQIAVEHMAEAVRQVTIREGEDCRDYVMVAFGGAGPQHACAVARELGVGRILVPGDAGLLSAWGLHHAGERELLVRQILRPLDGSVTEAIAELSGGREVHRCLHELRLRGQDFCLEVESGVEVTEEELRANFEQEYVRQYGERWVGERMVEWVTLRVELAGEQVELEAEEFEEGERVEERRVEQDGFATLVVEPGWRVRRGSRGTVCLDWEGGAETGGRQVELAEVVEAELYRRRFEGVVEEMGELLRRTAISTNIKERLDYSCALLDGEGRLVVNAPHIPVHLGALGLCVRTVGREWDWREGDEVVVNHPAFGGSHLPDVTVISPVFFGGRLVAFLANRAHHAEIGGKTPGSMPPDGRCLADEGVVIEPVRYGEMADEAFAGSRSPGDNWADLKAQVMANRHGVAGLQRLMERAGVAVVERNMAELLGRSARLMEEKLGDWPTGEAEDEMDDGARIRVRLRREGERMVVDFRGSAGVHAGNLNATPAIVGSAVLYVLRLWVGVDLPLNEGLLEQAEIVTEEGILDPPLVRDPAECPAVVGGNVETSQRVVDVLLMALGMQANGQGTMNNFLFGNERFGFYETMGGGAGAGPGWDGRSGCHVHMSNTGITDVEVLEERYPVRVWEFGLRRGSGGAGHGRGGDGLVREVEFLERVTVSLLTERRKNGPKPNGAAGRNLWYRDGKWVELGGRVSLEVKAGEKIRIETPGGGGWLQNSANGL